MMKSKACCRLLLDSCCDLPRNVLDEAGVDFFRFPFIMNDGEHFDDLGITMTPKEFYDRLRKGEVSGTAQVPYPMLLEKFEQAAQEGTPTVYLAFTSGLSGTYETVERVAEEVREKYPTFELYTVDTKLASVAEGLLVYEAIRQRERGLSARQLAEWAQEARWYVHCLFTVDSLEPLRRGGRIPDMAAYAGAKLDIKPLLNIDLNGALALAGVSRGRKKSLKALVACYQEDHDTSSSAPQTIIVGHADDESSAKWVEGKLDLPKNSLPPIRCNIGPTIGSHVGPDMVALVFWGADRRASTSIADRIASKLSKDK